MTDKNLVLQTSLPAKEHQQKNGGTDNPAFSADTNVGDHVTKTGLTRIVSVPLSAIDDGLLGIELSPKNKEDGKQMYTYKQTDGSKGEKLNLLIAYNIEYEYSNSLKFTIERVFVEGGLIKELKIVKKSQITRYIQCTNNLTNIVIT